MKPRKLAILGGTFNPIHNGHLHLLAEYRRLLMPDLTLLIPTRVPPHKLARLASEEDRMAMCRLAVAGMAQVEVSDLEFRREGPSYTADTLDELAGIYGEDAALYFIVGSDMFLSLESWYDFQRIFRRATLCAAARTLEDRARLQGYADRLRERYGARSIVSPLDVLVVSSTELRDKLARGEDVSALLPAPVERYIREKGLYGTGTHKQQEIPNTPGRDGPAVLCKKKESL